MRLICLHYLTSIHLLTAQALKLALLLISRKDLLLLHRVYHQIQTSHLLALCIISLTGRSQEAATEKEAITGQVINLLPNPRYTARTTDNLDSTARVRLYKCLIVAVLTSNFFRTCGKETWWLLVLPDRHRSESGARGVWPLVRLRYDWP